MVDTYDGATMIDANQTRACTPKCLCRTFRCPCGSNTSPLEFIVSLDAGQTKLFIRSRELLMKLLDFGVMLSGREVTESELLCKAKFIRRGSRSKLRKSSHIGKAHRAHWSLPPLYDVEVSCSELRLLNNYLSIFCGTRYITGRCNSDVDISLPPVRLICRPDLPLNNAYCILSGNPEEKLIQLVRSGLHVEVGKFLGSIGSTFSHRVLDPDAVISGCTALIAAIRYGNVEIIKRLILAGADVNAIAPCGTPLSIVTEMGSKDTIKLLLEQGADPELAKILLKNHDTSSRQRQFQLWASVLDQCKEEAKRSNISQLRYNFREEYRKFARVAHQVSPDRYGGWKTRLERDALLDWKRDVDNFAERGWRTGLRMLRKLCNRNVPRNVNEVIMGIALARAMAVVLDKEIDESILYGLNEDLSRWQLLFSGEARFAFSDAVRRIWGVSLIDPLQDGSTVAEEIVEGFQVMAEKLMEKARDVFGLDQLGDTFGSEWDPDDGSSRDTGCTRHDQDSQFSEHLRDGQQDLFDGVPDQTILIWLMAGVIFACLIAVLLGTLMSFKLPDGKSDSKDSFACHPNQHRRTRKMLRFHQKIGIFRVR